MLANRDGKLSVVLLAVIFVSLLLVAAGGYAGYRVWSAKTQPRTALLGMKLNADILRFSHRQAPDLYSLLIALDDAIALLDQQMTWLKQLEKQFPDQQPLIGVENESLKKHREELLTTLTAAGKTVETFYVSYLIDEGKGMDLIGKQKPELKKQLGETLQSTAPLLARLKAKTDSKWTDRLLDWQK